jgi:hypothetical protein
LKACVGVTDKDGYQFLSQRLDLGEGNSWQPGGNRLLRSLSPAVKQTEYVEAARALGVSEVRLSLTRVLRNCSPH